MVDAKQQKYLLPTLLLFPLRRGSADRRRYCEQLFRLIGTPLQTLHEPSSMAEVLMLCTLLSMLAGDKNCLLVVPITERTFIDGRGVDALHINLFTVVPLQRRNLGLMNGFNHNPKSLYGRAFAKKESRSYPREWIRPQSYTKG